MQDGPIVDMLWESADPGQELTKRFGFRDGASAAEWVADVLEQFWNLDAVRCDRVVISGRNVMAWVQAGDRPLVVKVVGAPTASHAWSTPHAWWRGSTTRRSLSPRPSRRLTAACWSSSATKQGSFLR